MIIGFNDGAMYMIDNIYTPMLTDNTLTINTNVFTTPKGVLTKKNFLDKVDNILVVGNVTKYELSELCEVIVS